MPFDRAQADFIFGAAQSQTPIQDILQSQFGVPGCAIDIANDVLSLLPSKPLQAINKSIAGGMSKAQDYIKTEKLRIYKELGILELLTENGTISIESTLSDSILGEDISKLFDAIGQAFGYAQALYGIGTEIYDKVVSVIDCIDQLTTNETLKGSYSTLANNYLRQKGYCKVGNVKNENYVTSDACILAGGKWYPGVDQDKLSSYSVNLENKYGASRTKIINALGWLSKAQLQTNNINKILTERYLDPDQYPEPCFDGTIFVESAGKTIEELFAGTDVCVVMPGDKGYCSLGRNYRDKESCEAAGGNWTDVQVVELPQQKFRVLPEELDPPISKFGKFILTETGIYFDSVSGGLEIPSNMEELVQCSTIVPEDSLKWMFEYNPNCGGRGDSVTLKEFNEWANTLFDLDADVSGLDTNSEILSYYDQDSFLGDIIGQKNRHIYELSSYVTELINDPSYGEDSSLVVNQRQALLAAISVHEDKIKRRKKQIQVGVVLGGFELGKIPINDFSFLDESILDVSKGVQSKLAFNPGEVSGIVLPINVKYGISKKETLGEVYLNHLIVPTIGKGAIISSPSSILDGSSSQLLSLVDSIATDDLIACYNFLNGNLQEEPDSLVYDILNTAETGTKYNAQLVASSFDYAYPSGVGFAHFGGICSFFSGANPKSTYYLDPPSAQYLQSAYRPLSYMMLPPRMPDFDSLLYRNSGFTLDCWIHVPTLTSSGYDAWDESYESSSMHRIIFGNENRGGDFTVTDAERLELNQDYNSVKGLLVGFTRDRRFTKSLPPSNENGENPVDEDLKFYIAPTRSINTSSVTFIPKGALTCFKDSTEPQRYLGAVVDVTGPVATTSALGDCSSSFKHLSITCDPSGEGRVVVYSDGVEVHSQNYINTFGFTKSPNIPSPLDSSSFSYKNIFKTSLAENSVTYTPTAVYQDDFWNWAAPGAAGLTPWIIGGGYTDGMTNVEFGCGTDTSEGMNFLGSKEGGLRSGLNGFIGSFKLYKRAISAAEVAQNFKAQKGFFKNIEL